MAINFDPTSSPLSGAAKSTVNTANAAGGGNLIDKLSDSFSKMLDEVNTLQLSADQKIQEFATSKDKDLHGTMIAMQKADVSLRLLLQVRSKLTSAYQEITRMQV